MVPRPESTFFSSAARAVQTPRNGTSAISNNDKNERRITLPPFNLHTEKITTSLFAGRLGRLLSPGALS
jgi:hypothetical protein